MLYYVMFFAVCVYFVFFFNDTATTEIYTLSLHDALPIYEGRQELVIVGPRRTLFKVIYRWWGILSSPAWSPGGMRIAFIDRKSTRLNSSHANISYAVFCLKKKQEHRRQTLDG